MTDRQWNEYKDDLKQIAPGPQDGPADPIAFKQRVLQEYERRTRQESRGRWTRRTISAATVAAAVWVGLLVAGPLGDSLTEQAQDQSSTPMNETMMAPKQDASMLDKGVPAENSIAFDMMEKQHGDAEDLAQQAAAQQVANQFLDLLLQKRTEDARELLSADLQQQKLVIPPNMSNPHMTGYDLSLTVLNMPDDKKQIGFFVTITRANYAAEASMESYRFYMAMENNRWVIDRIEKDGEGDGSTYYQNEDGDLIYSSGGGREYVHVPKERLGDGDLAFLSINPLSISLNAYVQFQGNQPYLYRLYDNKPQRLAALPPGEIGEIIWSGTTLLVNYSEPGAKAGAGTEILFYDSETGKRLNMDWLKQRMHELGLTQYNAAHSLPNGKVRLRSNAVSLIADLNNRRLESDTNSQYQITQVKYDQRQNVNWPDSELSVFYPNEEPEAFAALNIPQERKINLLQETGFYIVNGSLQRFSYGERELQIEVSRQPGRMQVIALPFSMFRGSEGQDFRITVFDESGYVISPERSFTVPSF